MIAIRAPSGLQLTPPRSLTTQPSGNPSAVLGSSVAGEAEPSSAARTSPGRTGNGPGSLPPSEEPDLELLVDQDVVGVTILPALSFLDLAWARLGVDPVAEGVRIVDGHRFATEASGVDTAMLDDTDPDGREMAAEEVVAAERDLAEQALARTRELMRGEPSLVNSKNKGAVIALREIAANKVHFHRPSVEAVNEYVQEREARY